jgi:ATP-dependent protease ClpP protease subunit
VLIHEPPLIGIIKARYLFLVFYQLGGLMAVQSDLIDNLIYGIDLKNRKLYFGVSLDWMENNPGDFSQASIELAIRALHKMASDAPGKPIEIHMNSYGGDAYAMLRLHDEILACPCQVKFYGGGAIMSAATWIMAVCDERWLHANATVMVHDGSEGTDGKHTDVQITAAESLRLQDKLYDIYEANSRMPKNFWQDVCQRDLYLTAAEAVSLGLADKIVEPKKRGNLRKMRQAALKKPPENGELRKLVNILYSRINKVKVPKIELNDIQPEPKDPHVVISEAVEVLQTEESDKKDQGVN